MASLRAKLPQAVAGLDIALADADHILMEARKDIWPTHYVEAAQALLDLRKALNAFAKVIETKVTL